MLVDPETGYLTGVASRALRAHQDSSLPDADGSRDGQAPVEAELFTQQIETQTPPCEDLDDLEKQLRRGRQAICDAANAAGAAAVAMAAPALVDDDVEVTRHPRYQRIREEYGELAQGALACAMHVHVDVADEEEGIRALDGIAPWLPLLLALSANSPYAYGRDTGHASWRTQIWTRWPSHGTGEAFGDVATYRAVADRLTAWGAGLDDGMVYFDVRLSRAYPTLEIRIADVTTELEDTVLVTALARALVATYADAGPSDGWRSDLLRAAGWRASRYGISGRLVDPTSLELVPARDALQTLVHHVRPALERTGDLERVERLLEQVITRGNGAIQQRRAYEAGGDLAAVVDDCRRRTQESCG